MEKIAIREARVADSDTLVALCRQLGYQTDAAGLEKRLITILDDPDQRIMVALDPDDKVVGWIHVFIARRLEVGIFVEIGGLVVDEKCRRMGTGKALMQAAEDWAKAHDIRVIRLRSNVIRTEAHQFYLDLGFSREKQQQVFTKMLIG